MSFRVLLLTVNLGVLAMLIVAGALISQPRTARATSTSTISAGYDHTCALDAAGGGLKCWGRNSYGQLGEGTTTQRHTPADVSGLTSGVVAVSTGFEHSCALTTTGGVTCWGANSEGQLGDGTTTDRHTPVDVAGLTSGVAAVSSGGNHTCALTTAGGLKCWGDNFAGKVGDGTTTDRHTPADVAGLTSGVAAVGAGGNHTCALTTAGGVKCWGRNNYGQLGDGTTTDRHTPVDVSGLTSGVAAIGAGGNYQTCAVTTAGGLKCWGKNDFGQLGDGTLTTRPTPVDVSGLTSGVAAVSAGAFHTCALATTGGLKCWGRNDFGQLGDATTTDRHTPVDVSGLTSGVGEASGGLFYTCALTIAGEARCWGRNINGQLGDGTTTERHTPVDVVTDSDRDGCMDAQELGPDQTVGGQRNPKYHWDFFDVWTGLPAGRDGAVSVSDIGAVVARFGATREPVPTKESALAEALTLPPLAPAYHTAFDRGGPLPGQNLWNLQPPDGSINIVDIAAVVAQFGHSCV